MFSMWQRTPIPDTICQLGRKWKGLCSKTFRDHTTRPCLHMQKKSPIQARRHKSTAEHIPKWGENLIHTPHHVHTKYVCYPQCTATTNLIRASFDNSEAMLGVMPSTDSPNMLCRQHYMELYRRSHPSAVCASCGATPKAGSSFTCHGPEPSLVSQHLTETTGSNVTIKKSDCICYACYKSHLSTVKVLAVAEQQPSDATLAEKWHGHMECTTCWSHNRCSC